MILDYTNVLREFIDWIYNSSDLGNYSRSSNARRFLPLKGF